jgi:hypothetical protein
MRPPLGKIGIWPFIPPFVPLDPVVTLEPLVILEYGLFDTYTFMTPPGDLGRKSTDMHTKSSLLGVALIIRSKEGPRFVFHYPPHLANKECRERPRYGTELDPTTPDTSDDEGRSDDDDLEDSMFQIHNRFGAGKKTRHVSTWDGDEHFESVDGVQIVPWEHLDAFRIQDLASILTPARSYHKKCFELTLDPLHFVTYPMHIREDGQWKKKKKPKKAKSRKHAAAGTETEEANGNAETGSEEKDAENIEKGEANKEDINHKAPRGGEGGSENGNDEGGMTMFNLVFILNPDRLEAPTEVADIFEHVAKDINKALRYAQSYSNYVWKESDMILTMKDKAREKSVCILSIEFLQMLTLRTGRQMKSLWHKILEKSSLAAAMRDIYVAISSDSVANVRFLSNPPVRLSVQIPKPYFLSVPPDNDEESMPGALITTTSYLGDSRDGDDSANLNKHSTLLLLDDEDKIIAEVQADGGDLAAPLLEYLKILKPTSSSVPFEFRICQKRLTVHHRFQQTSQANAISLSDIRVLAQHLIYYRRAIAIPPLHARETYILSPNSDNHALPAASAAWSTAFPLAPPLPTFLAKLSSAPRAYKTFPPSKPHRPLYMSMLAWLLRGGWVTPLRTFAWVIVWPEIRYEVEYALEAERTRAAYHDAMRDAIEERQADAAASSSSAGGIPGSPSVQHLSSEAFAEKARLHRLREKAKADQLAFAKRPKPIATASPSTNIQPHILALQPLVIKDPYRANHVDSLYLDAISKRFKDEKTQKAWKKCMKYFDGREALEGIALREGWKRKEAWNMLVSFEEFLMVVRHW